MNLLMPSNYHGGGIGDLFLSPKFLSSSGGSGGTAVNASGEGEFNMGSFFIEKNTGLDFFLTFEYRKNCC